MNLHKKSYTTDYFDTADDQGNANIGSPVIFDLDGDGVETTGLKGGSYFDHDGNGFAEETGWVKSDDGLLVMDRNGDGKIDTGKELFGNETILSNGQKADDGFQALAELDSNGDGKIDASDAAYTQLRIWQDINGDGYSVPDELKTLSELGIASINTGYSTSSYVDANENEHRQVGSFSRTDGTTGTATDVWFKMDKMYTIANEYLDVPADIAALPDLQGYGNVYDLQQAMVRDTSGQLKALVESFVAATDPSVRTNLLDQIIFKWTGSEGIDPASRGVDPYSGEITIDARKMSALEKFVGKEYVSNVGTGSMVNWFAGEDLNHAYHTLAEMFYGHLMTQTQMQELFNKITYSWDEATLSFRGDLSAVVADIQQALNADPVQGKILLSEFVRSIKGISVEDMTNYSEFRSALTSGDPSLNYIFDTAGLVRVTGTSSDDTLYIRDGANLVDAGAGNDSLQGYGGNIVYYYGRGSGNDVIENWDNFTNDEGHYTIWLGADLTNDSVECYRDTSDGTLSLVLRIKDTGETLTLHDWFHDGNNVQEAKIKFADGTIQDVSEILLQGILQMGTDGDDAIYGTNLNDTLDGGSGNDYLSGGSGDDLLIGGDGSDEMYGWEGNDTLDGGAGDDIVMCGCDGADTYIFGQGCGSDSIDNAYLSDTDSQTGALDKVLFKEGLVLDDLDFVKSGNDLQVWIKDTSDVLTIQYWFYGGRYKIDQFVFTDGTTWTGAEVEAMAMISGTDGDDVLSSGTLNDVINGKAGNDTLYGGSGNDTLDGGSGNDYLQGDEGSDTYRFGVGGGVETINNDAGDYATATDTVEFGAGITEANLEFVKSGSHLRINITGTTDALILQNWFSADCYKVDQFVFTDGNIVTSAYVDSLNVPEAINTIYGTSSRDILYGTSDNDIIYGEGGDDYLSGGNGDDLLIGGDGSDEMYGWEGNDTLDGGAGYEIVMCGCDGADTYIFGRGYGSDSIENAYLSDTDSQTGALDKVLFKEGLVLDDLDFGKSGNDLQVRIKGTSDVLTIQNWFYGGRYRIDQFMFSDGNMLTASDVDNVGYKIYGTMSNDTLYGSNFNSIITGESGDDTLYGGGSNDTLDGGVGDDSLIDEAGSDTYIFRRTDGIDTISDYSTNTADSDTVKMTDGIQTTEPVIVKQDNDLYLFIDSNNYTKVLSQFQSTNYGVERLEVTDGHYITRQDIENIVNTMSSINNDPGMDVMAKFNAMRQDQTYISTLAQSWHQS